VNVAHLVREALVVFAWVGLAYFVVFGVINIGFVFIAWRRLVSFRRARSYTGLDDTFASPFTPGISVLVPAYNEEAGIISSVRSLLDLRYPRHEVIVVNDGSTDTTLDRLRAAFDLVPVRQAVRTQLETRRVRAAYVSRRHQNLCVLDKENGGKPDALNAGINAAAHGYVCAIDADAVLEEDALLRIVQPMIDQPDLAVACGGIIRIANGCTIEGGRVTGYGLPRNRLATMQVVEYFRAFLVARIGWDRLNCLIVISGAFGLFSRPLVEAVGGYAHGTVGEDVELVTRLQRHLRRRGERFEISFVPDPVCWTEAPETIGGLSRQRRRWQRGLAETLWRHRGMIGNPRYGWLGLLALPYFVAFELLGVLFEAVGVVVALVVFLLGAFSLGLFLSFLAVSILVSMLVSAGSVVLEEYVIHRHQRREDVARLILYAALESFGYRQLNAYWRFRGLIDVSLRKSDWGEQQRRGLERGAEVPLPPGGQEA
jgi:cellulose synthase/poly-beta-1,6-N-acetylglucosamine synthase-like glycosyltransferase